MDLNLFLIYFGDTCESLGIKHQRIPVKTPNMNAHIESFHSILESDCYQLHEFESYIHVYEVVSQYMDCFNNRYRHGSLGDRPPAEYYQALIERQISPEAFVA